MFVTEWFLRLLAQIHDAGLTESACTRTHTREIPFSQPGYMYLEDIVCPRLRFGRLDVQTSALVVFQGKGDGRVALSHPIRLVSRWEQQ